MILTRIYLFLYWSATKRNPEAKYLDTMSVSKMHFINLADFTFIQTCRKKKLEATDTFYTESV